MPTVIRLLLVEDSADDAELILRELRKADFEVDCLRIDTKHDLDNALLRSTWDIVITDIIYQALTHRQFCTRSNIASWICQ